MDATEIADAFDRMDDDNRRAIDRSFKKGVYDAATKYGVDDWRTTGVAVGAGLTEALYTFFAMSGRGLVDVLRLGETLRKPSAGAAFRDALRVLQIIPFLGEGAAVGRMALARLAASGGEMSCVITGNTFALRLAGTRLFITLDELWRGANLPFMGNTLEELNLWLSPRAMRFPGLQNLDALVPQVEALGGNVPIKVLGNASTTIDDVKMLAQSGRGPVPFGVTWLRSGTPVGRHMMVMYRDMAGGLAIADQSGVRSLATFMKGLGGSGVSFSVEGYYLLENAGWVTKLQTASQLAMLGTQSNLLGQAIQSQSQPGYDWTWAASSLELPLYHLPGPIAVRADNELRRSLHRKPRPPLHSQPRPPSKPAHKPYLWDDPNLEGAEPIVRKLWAALRAKGLGVGQSLDESSLRSAAGLDEMSFDMALMELEMLYKRVHRFGSVAPSEAGGGVRVQILWP